jgi:hypothetical protein
MRGTIVLSILMVQSSYIKNIELTLESRDDIPDTVQWWISDQGSWRIKTFGLDHDIHPHFLGSADGLQEMALSNTRKHYADVIASEHIIELDDATNSSELISKCEKLGLSATIEVAPGQFAFWKPDEGRYFSQSQPG